MIAYSNMGGNHEELPITCEIPDYPTPSKAVSVGGDLRKIEVIRHFWQEVLIQLEKNPPAIWVNFSSVLYADTKLAACIVAIIRRANDLGVEIYIIGSSAVAAVLHLCKIPPLSQFTKVA